ncbi:hypothetical protein CKO51_27190 [Rhodopirellula sp. SM50]|nr:hypothetical protein CKO51_27190 [Rhodopirellula sp. SM50]
MLATELVRRVPRIAMAATLYRFQLETANSLKRLDCPILIAHSEQDELIDVSHAKRNFRAADYPNQLVELYGNHNSEKHHQANYRVGLDQFASEVAAYVG